MMAMPMPAAMHAAMAAKSAEQDSAENQ